jgi:hypothetical protein
MKVSFRMTVRSIDDRMILKVDSLPSSSVP